MRVEQFKDRILPNLLKRSVPPVRAAEGNRQVRLTSSAPGASRRVLREMLARGLYFTGLLRMVGRASRSYELRFDGRRTLPRWSKVSSPKFVIFCYHRVGTGGIPFFSSLPPALFEAQIGFLRKRYRIVSLDELYRRLQDPGPAEQAVAITFDDGYRDTYTAAFPILRKYGVPATIFLTVGSIETGQVPWYDRVFLALKVVPGNKLELELDRPRCFFLSSPAARLRAAWEIITYLRTIADAQRREWCAAFEKHVALPQEEMSERMLTWEQIHAMYREGIAFGSHTMTHPVLSRLTPTELERELLESKKILEQNIEGPVRDFAYPFGKLADCGSVAKQAVARCGYRSAGTTIWGLNIPGTDPHELRRVSIGDERSLAMFAVQLQQLFLCAEEGPRTSPMACSPANDDAVGGSERFAS